MVLPVAYPTLSIGIFRLKSGVKQSGKWKVNSGKMVVKCLPTFTFHFPARIGAMAVSMAGAI